MARLPEKNVLNGSKTPKTTTGVNISNQTSTSFSADNPGFSTAKIAWYACGQGN